jgi:hypothetical protein
LHFKEQTEEPTVVWGDMSKVEKALGPISFTKFEEAIQKTIKERTA